MEKGKPQDGIVSRYLNRPISRALTRVLLKVPITPTAWTLVIFVFPIGGALALARGSYWGFVIGTILYQVHSILDGCDGEIARAKNLQSERGERIDNWCDHAATFLLAVCLGIGLSGFYIVEGIAAAVMLVANELMLAGNNQEGTSAIDETLYPRHREMMRKSGISFLGEPTIRWLVQLTKRDVAIFVFLLLAIAGAPQWILHLLCVFAVISLTLASKARFSRAR